MNKIIISVLLLSASVLSQAADFIEVKKSVSIDEGIDAVWQKVGDFCAIQMWHPAVEKCESYDDKGVKYRTLTLLDGGKISEKHAGDEGTSYSYYIKKSPLPIKTYKAYFVASGDANSTKIEWNAKFKAKDVTDEEAKGVIEGIFTAGLASIEEMFK
ncbi:MAG: SRPBCC family protein [Pseudomonadota bacterium]